MHYADDTAASLKALSFDRRKAKRFGMPDYMLRGKGTSRFVAYVHWSRDCDCVEGERIIVLPATLDALNERIAHESEWADGPFTFTPVSLRDALEFEGWSRDRVMEAYENGHPHAIYDGDDDSDWY